MLIKCIAQDYGLKMHKEIRSITKRNETKERTGGTHLPKQLNYSKKSLLERNSRMPILEVKYRKY